MRWPDYPEDPAKYPKRNYGFDSGNEVYTEYGHTLHYDTWPQLKQIIKGLDLILITDSLFRYIDLGAGNDPHVKVCANDMGIITNIQIHYGRYVRHIVRSTTWNITSVTDVHAIRRVSDICSVGDRTSPSGIGRAIARAVWGNSHSYHTNCKMHLGDKIYLHSPVARTETKIGWRGPECWEYDFNSAYLNFSMALPSGPTLNILQDDKDWYRDHLRTWFRRCYVKLPKDLHVSPVPKLDTKQNRFMYYTGPNKHFVTWLWREQADIALDVGIKIVPGEGWGWFNMTNDNASACETLIAVKRFAKQAKSDLESLLLKKIGLAYIGRFAMSTDTYVVVPEDEVILTPDNYKRYKPLIDSFGKDRFTDFYLERVSEADSRTFIHWQRYAVMQANNKMFELAYRAQGEMIMMNFDNVILSKPLQNIPPLTKELHLTNVEIPYARALTSNEKIMLPGGIHRGKQY